jgi:hypothetical protein
MFPAQWLWVRAAHALLDRDEDEGGPDDPGGPGGRGPRRLIAQAVDRARRHSARKGGSPKAATWVANAMAGGPPGSAKR